MTVGQPFAAITVSNNRFLQDVFQPAVAVWGSAGITIDGNTVTLASTSTNPAIASASSVASSSSFPSSSSSSSSSLDSSGTVASSLDGFAVTSSAATVHGWVVDADLKPPQISSTVIVKVDGMVAVEAVANSSRPDLVPKVASDPRHGFEFQLPEVVAKVLRAGNHTLSAWAVRADGSLLELHNSPVCVNRERTTCTYPQDCACGAPLPPKFSISNSLGCVITGNVCDGKPCKLPDPAGCAGGSPTTQMSASLPIARAYSPHLLRHLLSHAAVVVQPAAATAAAAVACRDRFLSPFGSGSLWNVAIGSNAIFIPANIYPKPLTKRRGLARHGSALGSCANESSHPESRHTCPGAFGGITRAECEAKDCCFANHCVGGTVAAAAAAVAVAAAAAPAALAITFTTNGNGNSDSKGGGGNSGTNSSTAFADGQGEGKRPLSSTSSCPWCFMPDREYGPINFHADGDHIVAVQATDPAVTWFMQGWWGSPHCPAGVEPTLGNCYCHCAKSPKAVAFHKLIQLPVDFLTNTSLYCSGNNGLAMLQSDNVTVMQTQPAYRCTPGGPLFSQGNGTVGCPQPYPLTVNITSSGPETALGAHGGSGLSAMGGTIRLHEIEPDAPPISHAIKLELFAHQYYYGGPTKLNPPTPSNGGRTQYVWPATGSDSYTFEADSNLQYNGTNPHLAPGALLAIPDTASSELMPLLQTAPGRRIATALRDYGGYIVDDTASNSAAICFESGAHVRFEALYNVSLDIARGPWYNDLVKIFQSLAIVINNGPGSVGGGGVPRMPPLPPLCGVG